MTFCLDCSARLRVFEDFFLDIFRFARGDRSSSISFRYRRNLRSKQMELRLRKTLKRFWIWIGEKIIFVCFIRVVAERRALRKLFYPFMTPTDSCNDTLSVPILGSSSCTALTILIDPQTLPPFPPCVYLFPLILPRNISNVTSILIVLTDKISYSDFDLLCYPPTNFKISINHRFRRIIIFFVQNNR